MIRAERALGPAQAVVGERTQPQRDTWRTRYRTDRAHQAHRMEDAAELPIAWREIADLDCAAVARGQLGDQYGAVVDVVLGPRELAVEHDIEESVLAEFRRQQGAERRIAIERRQAAPDDAPAAVDQCGDAAIAVDAQIQIRLLTHGAPRPFARCLARRVSHARAAVTSASPSNATLGRLGPTMMPVPPS